MRVVTVQVRGLTGLMVDQNEDRTVGAKTRVEAFGNRHVGFCLFAFRSEDEV